MAAMGSNNASLKGDAEKGRVELTLNGETYTREFIREESGVRTDGSPYLEDPMAAELYAFLLEDNEARRAVARGEDLHEIIMRPIDTDEVEAEISRLKEEKRTIDEKIDEIATVKSRLTDLESERTTLLSKIESKEQELEHKHEELQEADTSVAESREGQDDLEGALEELKGARSELEDVKYRIETNQKSLSELDDEKERLQHSRADLPESVAQQLNEITDRIERAREDRRELDSTLSDLGTVIEFNEEMLGETSKEVLDVLRDDSDQESTTQQLVEDSSVVCWTCGSSVSRSTIEGTLEDLRRFQQEKAQEREQLNEELDAMSEERSSLQAKKDNNERIRRRLQQIEDERERRTAAITEQKKRRAELKDEIDDLQERVEQLEEHVQSEILNRHREVNQLEFELDRLNSELAETEAEIDTVESQIDEREQLQDRRTTVQEELEHQRSRLDRLRESAIEAFNEHMTNVLELLDYSNLERIWIEQTQQEVRVGRRKAIEDTFELHIVRSTESGTTYEDTIEHLSESERETTGLVFALAGYLVHDVHELLPLLLVDSLEAIDSERIGALIDYFEEYADYLVVALLSEDAAATDERHQRISDI
jgi:chromosome segregation ATPase